MPRFNRYYDENDARGDAEAAALPAPCDCGEGEWRYYDTQHDYRGRAYTVYRCTSCGRLESGRA